MPILLATMVKNEERVLGRMIDSALPFVDGLYVLDTGSTDDTLAVAQSYQNRIPVATRSTEWVDFSVGRNELLRNAIDFAKAIHSTHILLLDADHILHVEEDASLGDLPDGVFMVELRGALVYKMPYMLSVSAAEVTRWRSPTHEFQNYEAPVEMHNLDGVWLEHREDGGNRHIKFEQDERLLETEYAKNPNDQRTSFYLAQTIEHKDPERAIELYQRRFELGGWDEERYIALLRIARLRGRVDDWMRAWNFRPHRWEAATGLVKILHEEGLSQIAFAVAQRMQEFPRDASGDILFCEVDGPQWRFDFEMGLAAYYAGRPGVAAQLWRALLDSPYLPADMRECVERNLTFC